MGTVSFKNTVKDMPLGYQLLVKVVGGTHDGETVAVKSVSRKDPFNTGNIGYFLSDKLPVDGATFAEDTIGGKHVGDDVVLQMTVNMTVIGAIESAKVRAAKAAAAKS